jgi:hypothetical protein
VRIHQTIHAVRSFDTQPDNHSDAIVVPATSWGHLGIQTTKTPAPVRALKLHYVYTHTQPVSWGTTDLVIDKPTSRGTAHHTRLKFWLAGANGGGNGAVYDLQTVHGKVADVQAGHLQLLLEADLQVAAVVAHRAARGAHSCLGS